MTTQKAIAKHLGISQPAVSKQMADMGIDWKTAGMDEIRVAYIHKLRAVAAGHLSHDREFDLTRERTLTERVDRELKVFALAEKKEQLVNLEQLEPELARMVGVFRTELSVMGDRIKADIDAGYGIAMDPQILEEHIQSALGQLSRYDPARVSGAH